MATWPITLLIFPNASVTPSDKVVYNDETETLQQFTEPTEPEDLATKDYVDTHGGGGGADVQNTATSADAYLVAEGGTGNVFIAGLISAAASASAMTIAQTDANNTVTFTVKFNDAIWNALKILNSEVEWVGGGPSDGDMMLYVGADAKFKNAPAVTGIVRSTANKTQLVDGAAGTVNTGNVTVFDLQSSDDSVSVAVLATGAAGTVDIKTPIVDLENTADVTSKYLLTNPGVATTIDPYLFKGINTQIPYMTFDEDADNILFNPTGLVGVQQTATSTTSIGVSQAETTMKSASISAGIMSADGQTLVYTVKGNYQSTASNLTIRGYFGGQLLFTVPTADMIGNSGSSWTLTMTITRTSSGNADGYMTLLGSDATSMSTNSVKWCHIYTLSGVNWATTNTFLTTAQTGSAGIISCLGMQVDLHGNRV